jgi:hypothetical protein
VRGGDRGRHVLRRAVCGVRQLWAALVCGRGLEGAAACWLHDISGIGACCVVCVCLYVLSMFP